MIKAERAAFLVTAALLLAFLALFPLLTLDAVGKLVSRARLLEPGNFLLVMYLELSRAFTTIVAWIAALVLIVRSARDADGRALSLFLIFVALTYEKISAVTVYPGPLQVQVTTALLEAGISRATLTWIFGPVPWTLWLALAALLRFSVVFPRPPLSAAAIDASGIYDRRGMMRGTGLAGMDIGAAFRDVAKKGLAVGAFRPLAIYSVALVLVALTTLARAGARIASVAIIGLVVIALAVTNLRASYNIVAETEKRRMRWLLLGFAAGGSIFLIAALPLLFFDNTLANVPALMLLMLAPATVMIGMALAVMYEGRVDAGRLLVRLPRAAGVTLAVLLVFAVTTSLLTRLTAGAGLSPALALLGALLLSAALFHPLRRLTDFALDRVLERPAR